MSARNKEIIEQVNTAFEENKPEVFLDFCTEDVRWEMAGDELRTGKESIRQFMASMGDDMEPPKINVTRIISDGDSAACYGDMTMVENGAETAYSYCDVYTFSGDKISELRSFVVKHKDQSESAAAA
jgi:uncharacterized protein